MTSRATRRVAQDPRREDRLVGLLQRAWQAYFAMMDRVRAGEPDVRGRALILCIRARKLFRAWR